MIHHLNRTQQLGCDLETAWQFFSTPRNLSRITPSSMKFIIRGDYVDDEIFKGQIINYTVSPLFGIPLRWRTEITQVDPKKSFTDLQIKGPYKLWKHHHAFEENGEGVLMKDSLDYELPFGFLGEIVHSLLVRKKLEQIFDYRYQVLDKTFNKSNNS